MHRIGIKVKNITTNLMASETTDDAMQELAIISSVVKLSTTLVLSSLLVNLSLLFSSRLVALSSLLVEYSEVLGWISSSIELSSFSVISENVNCIYNSFAVYAKEREEWRKYIQNAYNHAYTYVFLFLRKFDCILNEFS